MSGYLGDFPTGATIYVPFTTYNTAGASATLTGLAVTDIEIYKNGSVTQRASDAGYALLDTDGIDFDGITGLHGFSVDTNDNTDAGFFAAGGEYWIVVSTVTVDSQTVTFLAGTFSIERTGGVLALLKGANGVAAIKADTAAILVDTGTTLQAELDGIQADTEDIQTRLPAALVSGRIDASVGAMAANVMTAAAAAADLTTELQSGLATAAALATAQADLDTITGVGGVIIAGGTQTFNMTGSITGNLSGSVGSVSGAVGSVTGAVGSVGAGGITAASFGAGAIDAAAIAANAIGASELAADAASEIAAAVRTELTTELGRVDAAVSTRATPAQILTTALTESYAADGVEGTLSQILYFIQQVMTEFAISGTTISAKKLDGVTEAATFTLDSSSAPTSRTRAT